jgi:hypothetical protein
MRCAQELGYQAGITLLLAIGRWRSPSVGHEDAIALQNKRPRHILRADVESPTNQGCQSAAIEGLQTS